MDWLKKLLEGAKITDGKLDIEALMTSINTEFPKNAVPKDKYNDISGQLKTANDTIKDLKKNNGDNEALQNTIKDHEKTIANLKADSVKREKEYAIKSALEKEGCTDSEYIMFKAKESLEKLDLSNEDYKTELSNIVKSQKENSSTFFKAETDPGKKEDPTVIENKLKGGDAGSGGDDTASVFENALNGKF